MFYPNDLLYKNFKLCSHCNLTGKKGLQMSIKLVPSTSCLRDAEGSQGS